MLEREEEMSHRPADEKTIDLVENYRAKVEKSATDSGRRG